MTRTKRYGDRQRGVSLRFANLTYGTPEVAPTFDIIYSPYMAEAIAFDTHRFVKHLTQKGFTQEQAEALAEEQVNLLNSNLATKADLAALRADLELSLSHLKVELLKWMFGALVAQGGLVVALIKLL